MDFSPTHCSEQKALLEWVCLQKYRGPHLVLIWLIPGIIHLHGLGFCKKSLKDYFAILRSNSSSAAAFGWQSR